MPRSYSAPFAQRIRSARLLCPGASMYASQSLRTSAFVVADGPPGGAGGAPITSAVCSSMVKVSVGAFLEEEEDDGDECAEERCVTRHTSPGMMTSTPTTRALVSTRAPRATANHSFVSTNLCVVKPVNRSVQNRTTYRSAIRAFAGSVHTQSSSGSSPLRALARNDCAKCSRGVRVSVPETLSSARMVDVNGAFMCCEGAIGRRAWKLRRGTLIAEMREEDGASTETVPVTGAGRLNTAPLGALRSN